MNGNGIASVSVIGMGSWSAAGSNLPNTCEHLFHEKPREANLLDEKETSFLKLNIPSGKTLRPNVLALAAVEEALRQAGLTERYLQSKRVGVCLGSTVGGTHFDKPLIEEFFRGEQPDFRRFTDFFKTNSAQFISRHFNLKGPVMLVSNACTSGIDAIGVAMGWLQTNQCDIAICGGTESLDSSLYSGFKSLMLVTSEDVCRPFDKNRKGFKLGEGAGILVLEKSQAKQRPSLARIYGYGTASDAYNPTAPHPEARGLNRAAQQCLQENSVDLIIAHGVGSEQSDAVEGRWISQNFPSANVVALKGYTGHTVGAAGAISTILAIQCLRQQTLPPARGFREADPSINLVPNVEMKTGRYQTALCLALGFGGINSALYLGSAE